MDDPKNNFVEMIKIWEHHYSVHPVAIIIYDSTGGNAAEFLLFAHHSRIIPTGNIYLYLLQQLKSS